MALEKISDKQKEILEFIKSEILNRGYPPSVRDICEGVHLKSTSSVHAHLETLERKGYIRRIACLKNGYFQIWIAFSQFVSRKNAAGAGSDDDNIVVHRNLLLYFIATDYYI